MSLLQLEAGGVVHPQDVQAKRERLKTIQEKFSNEYSLDEYISALNWVGFNLYV